MIKPKKHAFSAFFQKESTAQLYHLCSAVMVAGVNKQYYVQPYISAKKQREKKNQVRCGDKAKISSDAVKKSVASLLFFVYKDLCSLKLF